jgi:hypothetical protein
MYSTIFLYTQGMLRRNCGGGDCLDGRNPILDRSIREGGRHRANSSSATRENERKINSLRKLGVILDPFITSVQSLTTRRTWQKRQRIVATDGAPLRISQAYLRQSVGGFAEGAVRKNRCQTESGSSERNS